VNLVAECSVLCVVRTTKAIDVIDLPSDLMFAFPEFIRRDSGPEIVATFFKDWLNSLNPNIAYLTSRIPRAFTASLEINASVAICFTTCPIRWY
jgi:hypothetical protein